MSDTRKGIKKLMTTCVRIAQFKNTTQLTLQQGGGWWTTPWAVENPSVTTPLPFQVQILILQSALWILSAISVVENLQLGNHSLE